MFVRNLAHLVCGLVWIGASTMFAREQVPTNNTSEAGPAGADQRTPSNPQSIYIVLTNTAAAPREASGAADLQVGVLSLSTRGLSPGHYDLSAVTKSDGASVRLGVLPVSDPTTAPDRDASDSQKEAHWSGQASALATQTKVTLPAGLPPAAIAQLKVSLGGNDMLVGSPKPSSTSAPPSTPR